MHGSLRSDTDTNDDVKSEEEDPKRGTSRTKATLQQEVSDVILSG